MAMRSDNMSCSPGACHFLCRWWTRQGCPGPTVHCTVTAVPPKTVFISTRKFPQLARDLKLSVNFNVGISAHRAGKIQPWVAGVTGILTLIMGLFIGVLGAMYVSHRVRQQKILRPEMFLDRKSPSTPDLYSVHIHEHYGEPPAPVPASPDSSLSIGAQDAPHNRCVPGRVWSG